MTQSSLISVINGLLNANLTEATQNTVNSKAHVDKQEKQKTSPDTQGVLGKEKGAALDAGGDKDVGGKKGSNVSDASAAVEADKGPHTQGSDEFLKKSKLKEADDMEEDADTQGVVGDKTKGAALDGGGDKDVGKLKEEDEEDDLELDRDGDGDHDMDDHEMEEAAQEASNAKNHVDKQEKQKTSPDTQGVLGKEKGAALDGGGDKDVGKLKEAAEEEDGGEDTVDLTLTVGKEELMNAIIGAEPADEADEGDVKMSDKDEAPAPKKKPEVTKEAKELKGDQHKLDVDKDGDIEADDLADLRKEEADEADEVEENAFDYKSPRPTTPNGGAGKKQGTAYGGGKQKKESVEDMEEEMDDGLEEDFKEKATIIFETAVNEKARMIREQVEAEYATKLQEEKDRMDAQVAEFVDTAVQEWLKENKLEIKYSLRTEIAENFIGGLKKLFAENYIEIPDEDVSVVDELTEAVESYKEQLEEQSQALEEAQAEILEYKRQEIVDGITEDLTETQKIRLEKLSESVEAGDIDEFRYKVEQLKESFFSGSEQPLLGHLSEEVFGGQPVLEEDTSPVSQYAKFLSKTVLK
jgi:hypothetical protein